MFASAVCGTILVSARLRFTLCLQERSDSALAAESSALAREADMVQHWHLVLSWDRCHRGTGCRQGLATQLRRATPKKESCGETRTGEGSSGPAQTPRTHAGEEEWLWAVLGKAFLDSWTYLMACTKCISAFYLESSFAKNTGRKSLP